MYIIAGLGNPEKKYEGSRHNTGFEAVDLLARNSGLSFDLKMHKALCAKGIIEGQKVVLAKPLTYMNLSGESIGSLCAFYKIDVESELIIISDDIDLPVGRIRIRKGGSAGGHNGLKNIIAHLNTDRFQRIKIGVGAKPPEWDLVDWVLGHISQEDAPIMKESIGKAAEAAVSILSKGVDKTMSEFNSWKASALEKDQ